MALTWPNKDPEEILDFPVDFNAWLVAGAGIASAQCVMESKIGDDSANPMVIDNVNFASGIVNCWLSGMVQGVKYTYKVTVVDDSVAPGPRTAVRRVKLTCKEK